MNLTPSQVQSQGLPENPRTALLKRITVTPKTRSIIGSGEGRDVAVKELRKVRHLVYWCPQCHCYHLWDGNDFEDVEAVLGPPE
jgi:hypothetical protein